MLATLDGLAFRCSLAPATTTQQQQQQPRHVFAALLKSRRPQQHQQQQHSDGQARSPLPPITLATPNEQPPTSNAAAARARKAIAPPPRQATRPTHDRRADECARMASLQPKLDRLVALLEGRRSDERLPPPTTPPAPHAPLSRCTTTSSWPTWRPCKSSSTACSATSTLRADRPRRPSAKPSSSVSARAERAECQLLQALTARVSSSAEHQHAARLSSRCTHAQHCQAAATRAADPAGRNHHGQEAGSHCGRRPSRKPPPLSGLAQVGPPLAHTLSTSRCKSPMTTTPSAASSMDD